MFLEVNVCLNIQVDEKLKTQYQYFIDNAKVHDNNLERLADIGLKKKVQLRLTSNMAYGFKNGDKISAKEQNILLNDGHISDNIIHCYASLIFDNETYIMPSPIASKNLMNDDFKNYSIMVDLIFFWVFLYKKNNIF